MKDRVKETFNQLASVYEHTVDTTSLYNSEYERPAMLGLLPQDLRNMTVLDAGCAAGWYTHQLIQRGANVVATDISPEMVNSTMRRVGDKAKVLCLDLEAKLPFKENTFDYIVSSLTLHYIKDWRHPFNEFKRILKPNGLLLFSVHHPFSDIKLLQDPNYFSTELIIDKWNKEGKTFEVPFYRRPLHSIVNDTLTCFSIEEMIEPTPTMNFKAQKPEKYEALMKCPQFLIIKAVSN
ncbi:class I SAM-dependent methyltransferase [Bacillus alkalicellulosilyticus]|uniref:class I SAM-dependent methyltransferase n=1 Tax=Alkalihalobacterium alkalicellulosilyticum TaxID=1912214 RepID=UPI0009973E07|nr:class I SAM-dependent methyltransferase [Bacillus alkalicellulosilyticus]